MTNDNLTIHECALSSDAGIIQLPSSPLNPEDLTVFAIAPAFQESVVKKLLTNVPVRKPTKESFVRTHPDLAHWARFGLLEFKETGKTYLLTPELAAEMQSKEEPTFCLANLVLSVDRKSNVFLWPVKIPRRESDWTNSARRAAEHARSEWVRLIPNMSTHCYDIAVAKDQNLEPVWPTESYKDVLGVAFSNRVISSMLHPVVQELLGA
jgi:hypothetical protein